MLSTNRRACQRSIDRSPKIQLLHPRVVSQSCCSFVSLPSDSAASSTTTRSKTRRTEAGHVKTIDTIAAALLLLPLLLIPSISLSSRLVHLVSYYPRAARPFVETRRATRAVCDASSHGDPCQRASEKESTLAEYCAASSNFPRSHEASVGSPRENAEESTLHATSNPMNFIVRPARTAAGGYATPEITLLYSKVSTT